MSHDHSSITSDERPIRFLFENSLFLIFGTIAALVWANSGDVGAKTHDYFFNKFELKHMFVPDDGSSAHGHDHESEDSNGDEKNHSSTDEEHSKKQKPGSDHTDDQDPPPQNQPDSTQSHRDQSNSENGADGNPGDSDNGSEDSSGEAKGDGHDHEHGHPITWSFLINDVLMALFFAIAAKEVWEALLPGGALSNPRKAAMPLLATLGGIIGPAGLYAVGVLALGLWGQLGSGWAVPCATDIAFSYLVARLIFGTGHPAIAFLLLLAIADDAAGLVIIAIFYPQQTPELMWLGLSILGMVIAVIMRKAKIQSFWWYLLIPGVLSWFGFYWAHIHPALGLVPIIPCMPHASSDLGLYAKNEWKRGDTLNEFEHWWKNPVEVILGLFGLCNAGVAFGAIGYGTWLVLVGLLIGKPVGITIFTWIGEKFFKLSVPEGMDYRDVVTLGCIAGIGFTVALFVSTAAFPSGDPNLGPVKMGALLSFGAAILSFIVAKALGVKLWNPDKAATPE